MHIHTLADQYIVSDADPAPASADHSITANVGVITDMKKTRRRSLRSTATQPQVSINACIISDLDSLAANAIQVSMIPNGHMVTRRKETWIQKTRISAHSKTASNAGTTPSQNFAPEEFEPSVNIPAQEIKRSGVSLTTK
jgi:hypothetical protein